MKKTPPVLVSACLAGLATRYDGTAAPCEHVLELVRQGRAIPVCPEQLGGRPTPRLPNEIVDGRVLDSEGEDFTDAFIKGAEEALALARLAGCSKAILKSRSPSCGCGRIYDGSFDGRLVKGDGVFATLLLKHGFSLRTEEDAPED